MQNRDLIKDIRRSEELLRHIKAKIAVSGFIPFVDFMSDALYYPNLGYYHQEKLSIGREGDFITAPELSPLFADCLALEVSHSLKQLESLNIIEYGAGSGQLAIDLFNALLQQEININQYIIIEISESLRRQQQEKIKNSPLSHKVYWLEKMPDNFSGVIIANEVLDAFPVTTFSKRNGQIYERVVTCEHDKLIFKEIPPSDDLINALNILQENIDLPNDYSSEMNLSIKQFLKIMTASISKAMIYFIDYGYGAREYYHPARRQGTLTCFYRHQRHDNPFNLPGLQDITAHVDFSRVANSALELSLSVQGFTTQGCFLLATGITEKGQKIAENLSSIKEFELHQAIKRLTFPMEMGETIKVMALSKNITHDFALPGFSLKDRRCDL